MSRGSFTATLIGVSESPAPTFTVYYAINSDGLVHLSISPGLGITGTSNSALKALSGMPEFLWPVHIVHETNFSGVDSEYDSALHVVCMVSIRAEDGRIDLNRSARNLGWTPSGQFGAYPFEISYLGPVP